MRSAIQTLKAATIFPNNVWNDEPIISMVYMWGQGM
jgi:hypothetical protein